MTGFLDTLDIFDCTNIERLRDFLVDHSHSSEQDIDSRQSLIYEDYLLGLGMKTILVEKNYIDHDYLEDYAAYYARCFKEYARVCVRLHFFKERIRKDQLFAYLAGTSKVVSSEFLDEHYLGFMVIRPIPRTLIGRTCLKPFSALSGAQLHITRKYKVNLFGTKLGVDTLAFQEQDRVVAACATSALWSAFHYTGFVHSHPIYSPVEITKLATRDLPLRALPSKGLTPTQMAQAVKSIGLEPNYFDVSKLEGLRRILYPFLRGKIPVILIGILYNVSSPSNACPVGDDGRHAVTAVGYRLAGPQPDGQADMGLALAAESIDYIFVHDDGTGPFMPMQLDSCWICCRNESPCERDLAEDEMADESKCKGCRHWCDSISTLWSGNAADDGIRFVPQEALIPVYHKIRVSVYWIYDIITDVDQRLKHFEPDLGLVWHVYLTTVGDFKAEVISEPERYRKIQQAILVQSMPKYLWRATAESKDGSLALDFVFDATGIEQDNLLEIVVNYDSAVEDLARRVADDDDYDVDAPSWMVFQHYRAPATVTDKRPLPRRIRPRMRNVGRAVPAKLRFRRRRWPRP